jgi:hypothetical protein
MKSLFKRENYGEIILGTLFIIYLLMGNETPSIFAEAINSVYGKIFVLAIVISLFLYANPILATLALLTTFEMMRRSSSYKNDSLFGPVQEFQPIPEYPIQMQQNNSGQFTKFNQFPFTLEQEVVKKMVPLTNSGKDSSPAPYKPVLEDLYDASPLNNNN